MIETALFRTYNYAVAAEMSFPETCLAHTMAIGVYF